VALTTCTVIAIFDEIYVLTGYPLNTYSLMQVLLNNVFGKDSAFAYLVTLATGLAAIGHVREPLQARTASCDLLSVSCPTRRHRMVHPRRERRHGK
jgi:hypothetical protein